MNKIVVGLVVSTVGAIAGVSYSGVYSVGDYYAQTLTGTYVRISDPYILGLCLPLSSRPCAFVELPSGTGHIPYTFTYQQAQAWQISNYLEPTGSGFYLGL